MTHFITGTKGATADWLSLAAAPTFAAMALLTIGGGDMLCTMPGMSVLSGMSVMYLLMSFFHVAPWLKRHCNARNLAKETDR